MEEVNGKKRADENGGTDVTPGSLMEAGDLPQNSHGEGQEPLAEVCDLQKESEVKKSGEGETKTLQSSEDTPEGSTDVPGSLEGHGCQTEFRSKLSLVELPPLQPIEEVFTPEELEQLTSITLLDDLAVAPSDDVLTQKVNDFVSVINSQAKKTHDQMEMKKEVAEPRPAQPTLRYPKDTFRLPDPPRFWFNINPVPRLPQTNGQNGGSGVRGGLPGARLAHPLPGLAQAQLFPEGEGGRKGDLESSASSDELQWKMDDIPPRKHK